ncbi:MAG: serine hydrolase domain-containing protein, partial [Candidatus Limnocylindrales bacterium]
MAARRPTITARRSASIATLILLPLVLVAGAIVVLPEARQLVGLAADPAPTGGAAATEAPATDSPEPSLAVPSATPYVPGPVDIAWTHERLDDALRWGSLRLAPPGMVASVLFPDGHIWTGSAGVADLATRRALTPDTPFPIASISKTFLAAEILSLVDEGIVTLDDAVAARLPGLLVGDRPINVAITIRQLLDHTSGLRDFLLNAKLNRAVLADHAATWTLETALAFAGAPIAKPGVGYHYANTNYVLLGLIAESATGRSLAAEYRARFFEPLGLQSATYQGVEQPVMELPAAYVYATNKLDEIPADLGDGTAIRPFTSVITAAGAAGSIAASAPDLARWAQALYGGAVVSAAGTA